jgi:hypothetical protein
MFISPHLFEDRTAIGTMAGALQLIPWSRSLDGVARPVSLEIPAALVVTP